MTQSSALAGKRVPVALMLTLVYVLPLGCKPSTVSSPCDPIDPALAHSSVVLVTDPAPGARVLSPLRVRACSRTFESNIVWELRARDGRLLASGHTSGGGVAGADRFSFSVSFAVSDPQVGHFTVFELDASEGEGFPNGRSVVPLVLLPTPQGSGPVGNQGEERSTETP